MWARGVAQYEGLNLSSQDQGENQTHSLRACNPNDPPGRCGVETGSSEAEQPACLAYAAENSKDSISNAGEGKDQPRVVI